MSTNLVARLRNEWKAKQDSFFPKSKPNELYPSKRHKLYTYSKIKADKEIRLFTFKPTEQSQDIFIQIEYARIDYLPTLECISYVWGDPSVRRNIYCNGRVISVTLNLWDALQRIRAKVGNERRFWADQICIHQADLKEKSAQVAMMSTIFPSTQRVICWLGEEDEATARAFDVLNRWERAERDEDLRLHLGRAWSSDTGPKTPNQLSEEAALTSFFSRQWFRRAWTLQEVFVSNKNMPIVVCGSHEIPWSVVCVAFLMLCTTLSSDDSGNALGENVRFVLPMFCVFLERGHDKIRLSRLVRTTADREATDPRDRIFALLGIMQQEQFAYPEPDYELTTKQVYIRYTRAMIEKDQNLDALSLGRIGWPNDDMPSWVLSPERIGYSEGPLFQEIHKPEYPNGGSTGRTKPIMVPANSRFDEELQLYGMKLDRIVRLYKLKSFARTVLKPKKRWQDILADAESFGRYVGLTTVYQRTGEEPMAAFLKTLVMDDFYVGCARSTNATNAKEILYNRFLRHQFKHVIGDPADASAGAERSDQRQWSEQSLYKLAQQTFHFGKSGADQCNFDQKPSSGVDGLADSNTVEWLDGAVSSDLAKEIQTCAKRSKLAITANGLLALVSNAANIGDELCLLMGGFLPFVLHEVGEGKKYRLIGEAYVHGFMDGGSGHECEERCKAKPVGYDYPPGLTKFCLI